ncbi:hypothetical protein BV97_03937 [Novosphingobium resinovorum]|uniref:TolA-binding protein n=1 Tax=Novosphingobium resinovorum TaxID=158500 RepID=A0A031JRB9_9SPHN|nr:hypothetical protein [Novosphingobium resinovorum]EZP79500.1 hypothetical protein BV97_03937 [Novosphingobium resinovorum]
MKRTLGAIGGTSRARWLATVAAASVLFGAAPAIAQDANTNLRLNKVEAEVRALQRKVFPGADGKFFEPQISGTPTPTPAPGAPSTTPLSDVLTRMDAVEARMAQLTAQVEQNTNRIGQLEAKLAAAAPAQSDFVPGPSATGPMPSGSVSAPSGPAPLPTPVAAAPRPAPTPVAAAPKPTAPSNSRIDGVKAIVKPQSADPGDDEYSYGFRLWEAKYYPEAQQQLKLYLEKYPKHARASFGRNLLGRAYLDDGNPGEAAKWFLQNFQTDKRGDRASDSLLYLAVSMKQLKDTKRACIALSEFSETYAAEAAGRLAGIYNTTRNGLACS